MPFLIMIWLA